MAAWSPDGQLLAYVAEVDGYRQLFVRPMLRRRRAAAHPRPSGPHPARVVTRRRTDRVRARRHRDGQARADEVDGYYFEGAELWTHRARLRTRRRSCSTTASIRRTRPDGQRLAFDAELAGAQRVWVADTRGRNPRQVTSDSSEAVVHTEPRWSPDGSKLVFRRIEKLKSDIAIVDAATQAVTRVTDDYVVDVDPTWSPDGRSVYFSSSRGGGAQSLAGAARRRTARRTALEQLTTGAGDDVQASVHPDGRELAFAVRGINSDLWRLPVSPETGRATGPPDAGARHDAGREPRRLVAGRPAARVQLGSGRAR